MLWRNVKIRRRFHVICNRSEGEKRIEEIVILPCQEITLSVLYLRITLIFHVKDEFSYTAMTYPKGKSIL